MPKVIERIKLQCYSLPGKPKEFLDYIEEKLAEIPKASRASARIEFEHESGYDGSCDYHLEITYWRLERAAEKRQRLIGVARNKTREEARDRAELKRLQFIYGGTK